MYAAIWGLVGSLLFFIGEKLVRNATEIQAIFRYALLGEPQYENPLFYPDSWFKLPLYDWERQIDFTYYRRIPQTCTLIQDPTLPSTHAVSHAVYDAPTIATPNRLWVFLEKSYIELQIMAIILSVCSAVLLLVQLSKTKVVRRMINETNSVIMAKRYSIKAPVAKVTLVNDPDIQGMISRIIEQELTKKQTHDNSLEARVSDLQSQLNHLKSFNLLGFVEDIKTAATQAVSDFKQLHLSNIGSALQEMNQAHQDALQKHLHKVSNCVATDRVNTQKTVLNSMFQAVKDQFTSISKTMTDTLTQNYTNLESAINAKLDNCRNDFAKEMNDNFAKEQAHIDRTTREWLIMEFTKLTGVIGTEMDKKKNLLQQIVINESDNKKNYLSEIYSKETLKQKQRVDFIVKRQDQLRDEIKKEFEDMAADLKATMDKISCKCHTASTSSTSTQAEPVVPVSPTPSAPVQDIPASTEDDSPAPADNTNGDANKDAEVTPQHKKTRRGRRGGKSVKKGQDELAANFESSVPVNETDADRELREKWQLYQLMKKSYGADKALWKLGLTAPPAAPPDIAAEAASSSASANPVPRPLGAPLSPRPATTTTTPNDDDDDNGRGGHPSAGTPDRRDQAD